MINLRYFSLLLMAGCFIGTRVDAEGTVTLSWDRPASATSPAIISKSFAGPGSYDLYATLTGQTTPVRCFELILQIGKGSPQCPFSGVVPQAWRFDDCHARQACFTFGGLLNPSTDAAANTDMLSGFNSDNGWEQVIYAECDPLPLRTPDPTETYLLLHYRFSHTGQCPGETDSVYVYLAMADWTVVTQDVEYSWNTSNRGIVLWNGTTTPAGTCLALADNSKKDDLTALTVRMLDPNFVPCEVAVSARTTTWGWLRSAYR